LPLSIVACSLETSRRSPSDSMSTEVGFSHPRRASVVSWQVVLPFRPSFRE
jgi:hypothetical protein